MTHKRAAANGPSNQRQKNHVNGGSSYNSYMVRPYQGFFEVIGRAAVEGTTMMLPEDFVRKYGDELSDTAKISVPHGCCIWKLGFKKRNNNVWFDDGWQEFLRYHSIKYGYYLAFTYKGMSHFKVRIYKVDGCEISYSNDDEEEEEDDPIMMNQRDDHRVLDTEEDDDDDDDDNDDESIEVVETRRGSSSKRKTPSSPPRQKQLPPVLCNSSGSLSAEASKSQRRSKKGKRRSHHHHHHRGNEDDVVVDDEHDLKHARFAEKEARVTEENMLLLKRLGEEGIITNERFLSSLCEMSRTSRKAVHEAIMMKPRHPCFLVFMKPINIFQTRVYIPAKFMKKHMSSPPETIRIIQPPQLDGMSTEEQQEQGGGWTIHVSVQDRGGLTLTKGLVEFVRESRIRMGDICVFELISSFPFVFKVSILRGGSAAE